MSPAWCNAQGKPLALDLGGDRRECGIGENRSLEGPAAARAPELFRLAVVTCACGLDERGLAAEERPKQASRGGLPQGLMGVDHVEVEPQPAKRSGDAGQKAHREQRPASDGLDPAMDENAAIFLVVNGVAGNGPGDDVHPMPAAGKLSALGHRLPLGAAFEGMKVTHDVANA